MFSAQIRIVFLGKLNEIKKYIWADLNRDDSGVVVKNISHSVSVNRSIKCEINKNLM